MANSMSFVARTLMVVLGIVALPAIAKAQDDVVGRYAYVKAWRADVKVGKETVATVNTDTWWKIEKVNGAFYQVTVRDANNANKQGWISRDDVSVERSYSAEEQKEVLKSNDLHSEGLKLAKEGKYNEAAAKHEQALAIKKRIFGDKHPTTAAALLDLAYAKQQINKTAEAEKLIATSVEIRLAKLGNHPWTAVSLNELASLHFRSKRYAEAAKPFKLALDIREATLGKEHALTALALSNLAETYLELGRNQEAELLSRKALKVREAALGKDHLETAFSLNQLATLQYRLANYAEAETLYQRCLAIREAKQGMDHLQTAQAASNLAEAEREMLHFEQAERHFHRCLEIREAKLGKDELLTATTLSQLGSLYSRQRRYSEAERFYRRSLAIREAKSGKNHTDVAASLSDLAWLSFRLGKYADALAQIRRSLEIREAAQGKDHVDTAGALYSMGVLYGFAGRYADGEPLLRRALAIREEKLGKDHLLTADTLAAFGNVFHAMGRFQELEPLLNRSVKIYESKSPKNNVQFAVALHALAMVYHATGRYELAEPLYKRAIAIYDAARGKDHVDCMTTLALLGHLYQDMGRYAEAEPVLLHSVEVREVASGKDHPMTAHNVRLLAFLYHAMGRNEEAEPLFRRYLENRRAVMGNESPHTALGLSSLGMVQAALGRSADAREQYDQARRISHRYGTQVLPALTAEQQRAYLMRVSGSHVEPAGHCEDNLRDALSLATAYRSEPEMAEFSAAWLANSKGMQHEALALAAQLQSVEGPQAGPIAAQLREVRLDLTRLKQEAADPDQKADKAKEVTRLETQDRELTAQLQKLGGRAARGREWVELKTIRDALPAKGVLVDFARFRPWDFKARKLGEGRYFAWVIPQQGAVQILDLGEAASIDALIAGVQQELASAEKTMQLKGEPEAEAALRVKARAVAERVLDPLMAIPEVQAAEQWILSPDGNLWLVPWGALPLPAASGGDTSQADRYVVEQYVVRMVTAARDVVGLRETGGAKPAAPLIVADPDFDLRRTEATKIANKLVGGVALAQSRSRLSEGLRLGTVRRLEGTGAEARLIEPHLKEFLKEAPQLRVRNEALESVVKAARQPRMLVLSTHGFFLPDQEVKGGHGDKASSGRGGTRTITIGQDASQYEEPLLRCGLLLAACNDQPKKGEKRPGDDGVLTGLEVAGIDLRGCELVVLSACETGLGDVQNGEGVAGLRQAFQLAGARSVVATLWQIPDRDSALLVNDFFGQLAQGRGKSEALRQAQIERIKARREQSSAAHPFFWAAYTLTGQDLANEK